MKESDISRAIQIAATREGYRLFRQNVGLAWVGDVVRRTPTTITLLDPRPLRAGLCPGSSDLIGWTPGGRFLAVEVKTPHGRVSDEQENFLRQVRGVGGVGVVGRSAQDAMEKIQDAIAALTA